MKIINNEENELERINNAEQVLSSSRKTREKLKNKETQLELQEEEFANIKSVEQVLNSNKNQQIKEN